jgi:hypothetical protein
MTVALVDFTREAPAVVLAIAPADHSAPSSSLFVGFEDYLNA